MYADMVEFIANNWMESHRGAVQVGPYWVLFGNDGHSDPPVTAEIEYALRWLREHGHIVCGLSVGHPGITWVIVVYPGKKTNSVELTEMLFDGWEYGCRAIGIGVPAIYRSVESTHLPSPPLPARFKKELADAYPEASMKKYLARLNGKFETKTKAKANGKPATKAKPKAKAKK